MAKMVVTFDMDNDSFGTLDGGIVAELDRIFQRISDAVWEGNQEGRIRDSNGNTVGRWEITS
jgi:hypothetical protein